MYRAILHHVLLSCLIIYYGRSCIIYNVLSIYNRRPRTNFYREKNSTGLAQPCYMGFEDSTLTLTTPRTPSGYYPPRRDCCTPPPFAEPRPSCLGPCGRPPLEGGLATAQCRIMGLNHEMESWD